MELGQAGGPTEGLRDDRSLHRRRPRRRRPHHRARPRSHRQMPCLPLCRLDRLAGASAILPARCAHHRYGADVARRDRGGICPGGCGRRGCGAAAFRRPLGLERRCRADPPAREERHCLYDDTGRALFCSGRFGARPGAHHSRRCAEPRAHPRVRPRLAHAEPRDPAGVRRDGSDACHPSRYPCTRPGGDRTHTTLWRRLSCRDRRQGLLAG